MCKIGVQFHSLACEYPVLKMQFVEENIFSYELFFTSLSNISGLYMHSFIRNSQVCSTCLSAVLF